MALTDGQVDDRRERLADFLDAWGDLRVRDAGHATATRLLEFVLEAPGSELPAEVRATYRESYRRARSGRWALAKYAYEYLDVGRSTRLAYHLHDIGPRAKVAHAHCERTTSLPLQTERGRAHHLRATEVDLREAHAEFMRLWASDQPPDCGTFHPLRVRRDA